MTFSKEDREVLEGIAQQKGADGWVVDAAAIRRVLAEVDEAEDTITRLGDLIDVRDYELRRATDRADAAEFDALAKLRERSPAARAADLAAAKGIDFGAAMAEVIAGDRDAVLGVEALKADRDMHVEANARIREAKNLYVEKADAAERTVAGLVVALTEARSHLWAVCQGCLNGFAVDAVDEALASPTALGAAERWVNREMYEKAEKERLYFSVKEADDVARAMQAEDRAEKAEAEVACLREEHEADRRFCSSVHTEPLLDAVREAGLTDSETEGPYGGGGVDHAHTIRFLGAKVARLTAEVAEADALQERLDDKLARATKTQADDRNDGRPFIERALDDLITDAKAHAVALAVRDAAIKRLREACEQAKDDLADVPGRNDPPSLVVVRLALAQTAGLDVAPQEQSKTCGGCGHEVDRLHNRAGCTVFNCDCRWSFGKKA